MGKFLKILGILIVAGIVTVACVWFFARGFLEEKLHSRVVSILQNNFKKAEIAELKLQSMFPLHMVLKKVAFAEESLTIQELPRVDVVLSLRNGLFSFSDNIPSIKVKVGAFKGQLDFKQIKPPINPQVEKGILGKSNTWSNIDFEIEATDGFLQVLAPNEKLLLAINNLKFLIKKKNIANPSGNWLGQVNFDLNGRFRDFDFSFPVSMSDTELVANKDRVESKTFKLNLAGIDMVFAGSSDLNLGTKNWNSNFKIDDLSKMPTQPGFLPNGNWQGNLSGNATYGQKPGSTAFFGISMNTGELVGNVNFKKGELIAQGQVSTKINTQISVSDHFNVHQMQGFVNLKDAKVQFAQFLDKAVGVVMDSHFDFAFLNDQLTFNKTNFNFFKMQSELGGMIAVEPNEASALSIKIQPTNLAGFEKHIPLVSSYPMTGLTSIDLLLGGGFGKLENLVFRVKNYDLTNFNAVVKYVNEVNFVSISGPFSITSKGSFTYFNKELADTKILLKLNADKLEIAAPGGINKTAQQSARVVANLEQNKGTIFIRKASLIFPGLVGSLQGSSEGIKNPVLNLQANISDFDSGVLSASWPALSELGFKFSGKGIVTVKGKYDSSISAFLEQELALGGELNLRIPSLEYAGPFSLPAAPPAEEGQPQMPLAPFIKATNIINESKIKGRVFIDKLKFGEYELAKLNLSTHYISGEARMVGTVSDFYGGKIKIKRVSTNLLKPTPVINFEIEVDKSQLSGLVNAFAPDHKFDFVGRLSGIAKGRWPFPRGKSWYNQIYSIGSFNLDGASLRTLNFDLLAYDRLSSTPGIGTGRPVDSRTLKIDVRAKAFQVKAGRVTMRGLNMVTPEGNQLLGEGAFDFALNTDIRGDMFLVNAPVVRAVRAANKDKKGRLIVPFVMRGTLLEPKVMVARETVDKMISNGIRYEAEKTQARARKELKALEDNRVEAKKVKVKKKIKSLFTQ